MRSGRWQAVQRGVYVVFSGPLSREATLWAAVGYAGAGAALSHQTAAELHKITDRPSELIHVTIPASRRVSASSGLVIHHSRRIEAGTHPTLRPPRTRVVETVLDLDRRVEPAMPDRDPGGCRADQAGVDGLTSSVWR